MLIAPLSQSLSGIAMQNVFEVHMQKESYCVVVRMYDDPIAKARGLSSRTYAQTIQ